MHLSSTEEREESYLETAEGRKMLREEGGRKLVKRRKRKEGKEGNLWKPQAGPVVCGGNAGEVLPPMPACTSSSLSQVQQVQGTGNAGQEQIPWQVPTKELV